MEKQKKELIPEVELEYEDGEIIMLLDWYKRTAEI